jgi:hypothetical protein
MAGYSASEKDGVLIVVTGSRRRKPRFSGQTHPTRSSSTPRASPRTLAAFPSGIVRPRFQFGRGLSTILPVGSSLRPANSTRQRAQILRHPFETTGRAEALASAAKTRRARQYLLGRRPIDGIRSSPEKLRSCIAQSELPPFLRRDIAFFM